jgi:hypothetical protein
LTIENKQQIDIIHLMHVAQDKIKNWKSKWMVQ